MKKILFSTLIAANLLIACNNTDSTTGTNEVIDTSLAKSVTTNTTQQPVSTLPNPVTDTSKPTTNIIQTTTAPATSNIAGLNPAHGQPGHRCDISVGAPLNSAPAKPATVTTTTTAPQPAITTSATKTAPGMNPPHGEPGHKCEIAVGAPLNSAPAKQTITTDIKPAATVLPSANATSPVAADSNK